MALAEIIFEVRGELGVGVEVLKDPTMLVQHPNGNGGLPVDVGVLIYHGIRGSLLMPWFPVCLALLAPRLPKSQ
jgi:hypothetical protein